MSSRRVHRIARMSLPAPGSTMLLPLPVLCGFPYAIGSRSGLRLSNSALDWTRVYSNLGLGKGVCLCRITLCCAVLRRAGLHRLTYPPARHKRCAETINALQAFRKRNSDAKAALHQIKEQRTEVRLRSNQLHGA